MSRPLRKRLVKKLLASRATLAVASPLLRLYRMVAYGGFLWRHDPTLLRLMRSQEPVIFAVWHQDFVHTLGYISRWNTRRRTYALASASRDGSIAATAAESVGFRAPVRGSSAKGAARALRGLRRLSRDDPRASITIVCDGPRPPARVLQPGVLHMAQASGHPLWLLRTSFHQRKELSRSWARFHLPLPWSRGVVACDGPIHVPASLSRSELDALRTHIEQRLNALAGAADRVAQALDS